MNLLIRPMAVSVASAVMALFKADRQPPRLAQRLKRFVVKSIWCTITGGRGRW